MHIINLCATNLVCMKSVRCEGTIVSSVTCTSYFEIRSIQSRARNKRYHGKVLCTTVLVEVRKKE